MSAFEMIAVVIAGSCLVVLGWHMGRLSSEMRMLEAVFSPYVPRPGDPNYWARAHQYDLMWSGFVRDGRPVPEDFDEYMRLNSGGAA